MPNIQIKSSGEDNVDYCFVGDMEIGTISKCLGGWRAQLFGYFILPIKPTEQQAIQSLGALYKEECPA